MPTELERELIAAVKRHAIHAVADRPQTGPSDVPAAARDSNGPLPRAARLGLQRLLLWARRTYYVRGFGMHIDPSAWFAFRVHFDPVHPGGIHIGAESYISFGAVILTHDRARGLFADTRVGKRCFIGAHSIVLPGVTISDGSIVSAGSVVTTDVPPATIVAGNPARVIRTGIKTYRFGCLWASETPHASRGS